MYILDWIMVPIQIIIFLFTVYYFLIGVNGLWRKKEKKILTPQKTFAVIVAAHNESAVIGQLVDNLKMLDYPKELYDIFVIADNCTDNTAQIARDCGAIVHERFNDKERGKGFAMEWMFARLFEMKRKYDAVAIFDADNLVDKRFLLEMNNRLCKGDKLVQGYLDAKNPYDTWVSGTFAIAFWVIDHIWHLAKTNIGLSSVLGGTGMCITTDVLKKLFTLLVIALFACGFAACSSDDEEPEERSLEVTPANLHGTWELAEWNGEPLAEGTYCYIVFNRKDLTFEMYQKFDSMYGRHITGSFAIKNDPYQGYIISGSYDNGKGDWNQSYLVTRLLASGSMIWTAKDDVTDISRYERCNEVPAEILKDCKDLTEE